MFVPFKEALYKAKFLSRENRFILICQLDHNQEKITVHLQDPGRLTDLLIPNNTIYVSYHDVPNRKTKWTAELITKPDSNILVSLRSTLPNDVVKEAIKKKMIPYYSHMDYVRHEFTYGGSRWDLLLSDPLLHKPYLLEIKSVTMEQQGIGYFPDAPTKRGTKHVKELMEIQKSGKYNTGILFVCQREDIQHVKPAHWIDSDFAFALKQAKRSGVEIRAVKCTLTLEGITLGPGVPVEIEDK